LQGVLVASDLQAQEEVIDTVWMELYAELIVRLQQKLIALHTEHPEVNLDSLITDIQEASSTLYLDQVFARYNIGPMNNFTNELILLDSIAKKVQARIMAADNQTPVSTKFNEIIARHLKISAPQTDVPPLLCVGLFGSDLWHSITWCAAGPWFCAFAVGASVFLYLHCLHAI
jgi:hypothetical protein